MCTVSYLPTPGGFVLGSSRDESPTRGPVSFPFLAGETPQVLYPRDDAGGGTWITASETGWCLCLLNGAFVKHHHAPPYKKSRGLIVREAAASDDPVEALRREPLNEIEPFTLVLARADVPELWELRWDGQARHWAVLDPLSPHVWASATLYDERMVAERKRWFHAFIDEKAPRDWDQLRAFHLEGGAQAPAEERVRMKRPGVESVSVTGVTSTGREFVMDYQDFLSGERSEARVGIHQPQPVR